MKFVHIPDNAQLLAFKQQILDGKLSEYPPEYAHLVSEWRDSVNLQIDPHCRKLMDTERDLHVFDRVEPLQKCHLEYFSNYYESRHNALDEMGCAIFYLDPQLSVYHKNGNRSLLDELKAKGIRLGTNFSADQVGVFVANRSLKTPFINYCRVGQENYMEVFCDYACFARYGEEARKGFYSVNLIFVPLKLYNSSLHSSICYLLQAEDFVYKNSFLYPHVERRMKLLEESAQFSNDIFMLVDDHGDVAFLNTLFEKEFGKGVGGGVGCALRDFLPELDFVGRCLKSGSEVTMREVLLTNGMNENRFYYADCIAIRENQKIIGFKVILKTTAQMKYYSSHFTKQTAHFTFDDIKGENSTLQMCKGLGIQASKSVSNVLITGESGTGKELFAQAIHNQSDRRSAPFIPVNCAAIPKELIGSELFGYEEGAFTGAKRGGNVGKLEQADRGTIFLDEIAEMPLDMQAFLLRFLEDGVITRIGGKKYVTLDVRIIAATNKDLWDCVNNGTFRLDLFFRLNVLRIELPPLRKRADDMELLIHHFVSDLSSKLKKNISKVTPEVVSLFQSYTWPGNLRELRNVLERCINIIPGDTLSAESLPSDVKSTFSKYAVVNASVPNAAAINNSVYSENSLPSYREYEETRIKMLMIKHSGNKSLVAKELDISRSTLYKKLKEMNYDG